MEVSMKMQAAAFLLSLLLGVLFGVLYDGIRFVRVVFSVRVSNPFTAAGPGKDARARRQTAKDKARRAAKADAAPNEKEKKHKNTRRHGAPFQYLFVALTDFLFFAICAVLMCVFFFLTGDGRVRGFPLLGAFLGFLVYYNTIGRLFIGICEWLSNLIKTAIRAIFRWVGRALLLFAYAFSPAVFPAGTIFPKNCRSLLSAV